MKKLINGCGVGFVLLCLLHLFSQRPLWLDENYVYQNIVNLNYAQLFGPLKPVQSFPRVYLCLVKWIGSIFDNHTIALRFFSCVFMISSFFVWRRIYRQATDSNDAHLLLLVFSWLGSYWLVYYGAELKPYSMDVLAVGLCMLYFRYQNEWANKAPGIRLYIITLLLPFLLFFSYGCIFVFWIAAVNALLVSLKNQQWWPVFVVSAVSSLVCFAIFYQIDIRHSITPEGVNYWKSYFICTENVSCFLNTFTEGIKRYVVYWWGAQKAFRRAAVILIPVFIYALFKYGLRGLIRDRGKIIQPDVLSMVIFGEFVMLGLLQKYPFTGERITLFFCPLVFFLVIRAFDDVRKIKFLGNVIFFYYIGYCLVSLGVSSWSYIRLYLN